MRLRSTLAAVLGVCLLSLAAKPEAGIRPRYGGSAVRGHLGRVGSLAPSAISSPLEREVVRQLHAGLYRFDAEGEPTPDLVAEARLTSEGRVVELKLRQAWFHDGRPVTATDVRGSLERFVGSPGVGQLLRPATGPLARVLGEREIALDVSAAPALWPWILADASAAIVPAGADSGGIGAGPFALGSEPDAPELRLVAYVRHHRGRPLLDQIVYRAFDAASALHLGHRYKDVDVLDSADPPEDLGPATFTTQECVALRVGAPEPPLDDAELRAALLAAPRIDSLVNVVLGGRVERAPGLLLLRPLLPDPTSPAPDDAPAVKAGIERPLELAFVADAGLQRVADRLRVDLHSQGIRAAPRPQSAAPLAARLRAGSFEMALVVLPVGGLPGALELAAAAPLLGRELPGTLRRALGHASPEARDLYAAEREILGSGDSRLLFRRKRGLWVRPSLHDVRLAPDGSAILEDAWRWPVP